MRRLPVRTPDTDRRQVLRVPAQPFLRVDRNDYSIDPAFAGRRIEVRVSQTIAAVVHDTGELAARHRRVFANGLTITDPTRQTRLERQREKRRQRHQVEVEVRALSHYDQLIPALASTPSSRSCSGRSKHPQRPAPPSLADRAREQS